MAKSKTALLVERLIDFYAAQGTLAKRIRPSKPRAVVPKAVEGYSRMTSSKWRALRAEVLRRDKYICQYCGSKNRLNCDHKMPVSRGGSDDISNLTTACFDCNLSKYNRTVAEFLEHSSYIRYILQHYPERVRVRREGAL